MNSDATQFIYLVYTDGIGYNVMARLDVNPVSLGNAPNLTNPSASPAFVYQGYVSSSTLSVQTTSSVIEVGTRFILPNGFPSAGYEPSSAPLNDTGLRGDVAADGIFSTNDLVASATAPLGARTVRLKAEVTTASGKHHATAIDFTPLEVLKPPGFSVTNASVTEGDSGNANLTFTVKLSFASTIPASVNYNTTDGTAAAATDYTFTNGTLNFAPWEVLKTITVPVAGDTLDEVNETLFLNLSGPSNAIIIDAQGIGTITDNDSPPTLTVTSPISKKEGSTASPGQTAFVTTLSAPSSKTVKVNYATTNGTANSGSDYVARSGTLIFPPGEVSKTIMVQFIGDALIEANENFFLDLSTPVNATIAASRGTAIILNDDPAPAPTSTPAVSATARSQSVSVPPADMPRLQVDSSASPSPADTSVAHLQAAATISVPLTIALTGTTAKVAAKVTAHSGLRSITAEANGDATTKIIGTNPYQIVISNISVRSTHLTMIITTNDGLKITRIVNFVKTPAAVMVGSLLPE